MTETTAAAVLLAHAGGWDEIMLFLAAPLLLFLGFRYLSWRAEQRQAEEADPVAETSRSDPPGG